MNTRTTIIACLAFAAGAPAMAQPATVVDAHKYCWAENLGHINWRDAGSPAGQQGARLHRYFLSGFLWSENAGYINLGDGSPAAGASYANATGADSASTATP